MQIPTLTMAVRDTVTYNNWSHQKRMRVKERGHVVNAHTIKRELCLCVMDETKLRLNVHTNNKTLLTITSEIIGLQTELYREELSNPHEKN